MPTIGTQTSEGTDKEILVSVSVKETTPSKPNNNSDQSASESEKPKDNDAKPSAMLETTVDPQSPTPPKKTSASNNEEKCRNSSSSKENESEAKTPHLSNKKKPGAAIFSPNSAAVALSSLYSRGNHGSYPGSSPSDASSTTSASASSPSEETKTTTTSPPSDPSTGTKTARSSSGNTPKGSFFQRVLPTSANRKHREVAPPSGYPHSAPNGSPPTVYFSTYPPGYHEAPPAHHWRHPPQGPWTPLVSSKGHVMTNVSPPGATPHQMRGLPPTFVWDGSRMVPVMEPGTVVYHHPGYPNYPPMKDGSDPNSAVRLASSTSLVTPTPKKPKLNDIAPRHVIVHGPPGHRMPPMMPRPPPPHHHGGPMHMHPAGHGAVYMTMPHPPPHGHPPIPSHREMQLLPPIPVPSSSAPPPPPQPKYSRKTKSLSALASSFVSRYQSASPGTEVVVDEAAVDLGVERRRIYDVVNILESIQLVIKKGKNTYSWCGFEYLPDVMGKLQAQAINEYPDDARKYGLLSDEDDLDSVGGSSTSSSRRGSMSTTSDGTMGRRGSMSSIASEDSKQFRSLAKLSQQFLQVFLVGYDILSLPQASEMIQGSLSAEEYASIGTAHAHLATRYDPNAEPPPCLDNPAEFRRAAQRGLKTKIRRLYDIANVFLSIGLLRKVEPTSGTAIDALSTNRRPNFQWCYNLSPKEIRERYMTAKKNNTLHPQLLPPSVVALATGKQTPFKDSTEESQSTPSERVDMTPPSDDGESPAVESNPTPSGRSGQVDPENFEDAENDSTFVLANIHQSGGAFHPGVPYCHVAPPATPAIMYGVPPGHQ